jgi:hypothetical protein
MFTQFKPVRDDRERRQRQSQTAKQINQRTLKLTQIANGFMVIHVGSGEAHSFPDLDAALAHQRRFYEDQCS